ncbi:MAG TPA: hypothetical protein VFD49_23200 [Candidatus Dormibacteraeota bacterium]|nr:hypothetical protein [Candidatus Dormibacteraeota bacterium]
MERTANGPAMVLGIVLVLVGLIYLAIEYIPRGFLETYLTRHGWPIFVIVPGLVLVGVGMAVRDLAPLCIPGATVAMAGFVLLFQSPAELFETWTYAWALVVPGGVGAGMWLQGLVGSSPPMRSAGLRTMAAGLITFLLGAVFFEGIVHVSGRPFGFFGRIVPLLLIGLGIWVLARWRRSSR